MEDSRPRNPQPGDAPRGEQPAADQRRDEPYGSDRPLVVCRPDGRPFQLLEENEKGYRKSIEQGHLWALHPGTGRLLPFHEAIPVTITRHEGWYEAVLARAPADRGDSDVAAVAGGEHQADPVTDAEHAVVAGPLLYPPPADIGRVLSDLAAVIASRHRELPEGSYTTHLFTSGAEKIRKKTGEEAVELLLASTRETLVSESADLLYHLLVLLESEGISLEDLAAELERR